MILLEALNATYILYRDYDVEVELCTETLLHIELAIFCPSCACVTCLDVHMVAVMALSSLFRTRRVVL